METKSIDASNLPDLQSKDHAHLLNIIDQLRSYGIEKHVPLPQLIVCGDQSAGKSSALEAISGVRFPTKEGLCTRFATEVILRRDLRERSIATIVPSEKRPDGEQAALKDFQDSATLDDDFPAMIERAMIAMGLSPDAKDLSEDVLRVEISGPDQPHLTLVDLPGLYHSGPGSNLVQKLVRSYMHQRRSIILAVVSARSDVELQLVTEMTNQIDPMGLRTMGIITKPDEIKPGAEQPFLNLALNETIQLRLGWHVLKNRDYTEKGASKEQRDEAEQQFFSQGVWTTLPPDMVGIGMLKPRLGKVLVNQILRELPDLIRDVESGIAECQTVLRKLGSARSTIQEQTLHLVKISQRFTSLMENAVSGAYLDSWFGDAMTEEGFQKRLRAVVRDVLSRFAKEMRCHGHYHEIVEHTPAANPLAPYPIKIAEATYLDEVQEVMRRSRGRELPGLFNPLIIEDLFKKQSIPWDALLQRCSDELLDATRITLRLLMTEIADETTLDGLYRHIIAPKLATLKRELDEKVAELLRPYREGHPDTYNHYFTETIQKARQAHNEQDLKAKLKKFFHSPNGQVQMASFSIDHLITAIAPITEADMLRFASSEAMYCMKAYYKVAMKCIVDNFAMLGFESIVLCSVTNMLSTEAAVLLDEKVVQDIACEPEQQQVTRKRALKKLESLENGLEALKQLRRDRFSGGEYFDITEKAQSDSSEVSNKSIAPATAEAEVEESPQDAEEGTNLPVVQAVVQDADSWDGSFSSAAKKKPRQGR